MVNLEEEDAGALKRMEGQLDSGILMELVWEACHKGGPENPTSKINGNPRERLDKLPITLW